MTVPQKIYLVEDDDPAINYGQDLVMAMTPEACFALKNRGVEFRIMRDFYKEEEIRHDQDEIFDREMEWVRQWDLWLRHNLPELDALNLNAAHLHFSKFKFIIDTLMVHCREILVLLKKNGTPAELVYVDKLPKKPEVLSIENLMGTFKFSYFELLKTICEHNKIKFTHHILPGKAVSAGPAAEAGPLKPVRDLLKKANHFVKYEKWKGSGDLNILFLDAGVLAIDQAIKNCMRKGMHVYFKQGLEIYDYSALTMPLAARLELEPVSRETVDKLRLLAERLPVETWHWEWIAKQFGHDYKNIFLPYFQTFIMQVLPRVMSEYKALRDFCVEKKVRFIAARGSNGKNYPAALALGKNLPQVSSVCFQHSSGPLYWQDRILGELDYFDFAATMEPVSEEAFRRIAEKGGLGSAQVFQAPYYLRILAEKAKNRSFDPLRMTHTGSGAARKKPVLLYVPRKRALYRVKFNSYVYPLTWFYQLQKKMLGYLATRTDYEIYYKHSETSAWADETLFKEFSAEKYPHIKITTGRLKDFFPKVDRVLIDHSSTAMYEAAASGVPFLALYHINNALMPPNKEFFGPSLASFSEIEDVLDAAKKFLDAPPDAYRHRFDFAGYDPVDKLLELAGKKA